MKKIQFSSFGFSAILLTFVMICIVTFSTLTLVTANSDYKLSKKVASKASQYYAAEHQIYDKLADLDLECQSAFETSTSQSEFFSQIKTDDNHQITFTSAINDNQYIEAIFEIHYPTASNKTFYTVKKWAIVNNPIEIEDSGWNLLGE